MSGYREHSYDPYTYDQPGRPLRPFNWVQWIGVVLEVVGLGFFLLHIAGKIGWIAPVEGAHLGFVPMILGLALVNSRREPSTLVGSEQLRKNRKLLLITAGICGVLLVLAVVIDSQGAF